jgi:hypothetical protein
LLCISPNDNFYFDHQFGNAHFVPAFHPFSEITSKTGRGEYILFHGNLSVAENIQALGYLLSQVFHRIDKPVIVAGKDPDDALIGKIGQLSNVKLLANPTMNEMENIIRNAQICILPTFQDTGLKLKLLASLFSGRHCIANSAMIHKTGLEHLCHLADEPGMMISLINSLFIQDFTEDAIAERKLILEDTFSNKHNALKIMRIIDES